MELPKAKKKHLNLRAKYEKKLMYGDDFSEKDERDYMELLNAFNWDAELVEEGDKCGMKDVLGKLVVPIEFDGIVFYKHMLNYVNCVAASKNGLWGLVLTDGEGTAITEFEYDYIAPVYDELVVVKKGDKYGYLNQDGTPFTNIDLDVIDINEAGHSFINGFSTFEKDGKMGITDGLNISEAIFDEIECDTAGLITVKKDGKDGFIADKGKFVQIENESCWFVEA